MKIIIALTALCLTGCSATSTMVVEQKAPYDQGPTIRVECKLTR